MKKKILTYLILSLITLSLVVGVTYAWFTDSSGNIENVFVTGTVSISASEYISPNSFILENLNPGDSTKLEYKIFNTGSKSIYLRALISGKWINEDGSLFDNENVNEIVDLLILDNNWKMIGDYYYYSPIIDGSYSQPSEELRTISLPAKINFSGNQMTNEYQGKKYVFSIFFEAVQSSNNAIDELWLKESSDVNDYPLWDNTKAYLKDDMVNYDNRVFKARYWTKNNTPGLLNSPWQEITNEWRFFNIYLGDSIVIHEGVWYKARYWTQNNEPGMPGSPWDVLE